MLFDLWLFTFVQDWCRESNRAVVYVGPEYEFFEHEKDIKEMIDQDDVLCVVHCRFSGPPRHRDMEFLHWLSEFYRTTNKNTQLIYIHNDDHPMFKNIPKIHFLYFPEYFAYYYPMYSDFRIKPCTLQKKFLCPNKRSSMHRQLVYKGFYNCDLLKDSYFSYIGQSDYLGTLNDLHKEQMIRSMVQEWVGYRWPQASDWVQPTEPFKWLDDRDQRFIQDEWSQWQGFGSGELEPTWRQDHSYYQQSFCSIVIETSPDAGRINFSEKTVRTIALGHPFILIATQHSVQFLRDQGFDVYDDIIDHSYDCVEDDLERLKQAWHSIQQIAALPLSRLQEISLDIIDRRRYNIQQLRSMYYKMFDREAELVDYMASMLDMEIPRPTNNRFRIDDI